MGDKDCFLCQRPDCSMKCPQNDCKSYFCSEIHYHPHRFQIDKEKLMDGKANVCKTKRKLTANATNETEVTDAGINEYDKKQLLEESFICLPYAVCKSQEFGRHFIATRDIDPLELILYDDPAVVIPTNLKYPACIECLRPVNNDYRSV